jgi:hypothetical protein
MLSSQRYSTLQNAVTPDVSCVFTAVLFGPNTVSDVAHESESTANEMSEY